ncbi:MAG: undecaprenyl-phosphate glucose phosphotransferase [Rhodospirillaceae bacterium]|nr:undecaprenyl-phosphate glucose phosphotransferase [Rhodospirillaceae bacterium]MBT6136179.1 undecaprenyl-phosphate glucose phosphotransferase [Rhodospirillaceae bacterium]
MFRTRLTMALGALRILDPLAILLCGLVAHWIYLAPDSVSPRYWTVMVIAVLLAINAFGLGGVYRVEGRDVLRMASLRAIGLWLVVAGILLAGLFVYKASIVYSRGWFILWIILGVSSLAGLRLVLLYLFHWMRVRGMLRSRIAVVGNGAKTQALIERLFRTNAANVYVVGGFVTDLEEMVYIQSKPAFGDMDALRRLIVRGGVDEIILCYGPDEVEELKRAMHLVRDFPVTVNASAGFELEEAPVLGVERSGDVLLLRLLDQPLSGWSAVMKLLEDKILAVLILILAAPLLAVIAVLVRSSSSGPILFRQKRYGFNNNEITIYKFRTMFEHTPEDGFVTQATEKDPRVTPIGAFLRRSSMDELPQLFNVIGGSMSLVGPRPHAVSHNDYYGKVIDGYLGRHKVKPGITGWAQVNGLRGETQAAEDMRQRLEYDLQYIERWSVMFDLKILAMTPFSILSRRNAY